MPGLPAFHEDETDQLLAVLDQQRYVLRLAAFGVDEQAARATPSATRLSLGGLVTHLSAVETFWTAIARGEVLLGDGDEHDSNFVLHEDDTLAAALARYGAVAAATDSTVRELGIATDVPVPAGVPRFPADVEHWSLRWIVLHLIEETARHAGHADLIREALDGACVYPLMAAAEGWEPTPWVEPWSPSARVEPLARLASVTLDCADPAALAGFYATLIGGEVAYAEEEFAAVRTAGHWLSFQRVADYRPPTWPAGAVPNQAHLDLAVADLDAAEREALAAGAGAVAAQPSPERWRVLTDPAGHPFCLTVLVPA